MDKHFDLVVSSCESSIVIEVIRNFSGVKKGARIFLEAISEVYCGKQKLVEPCEDCKLRKKISRCHDAELLSTKRVSLLKREDGLNDLSLAVTIRINIYCNGAKDHKISCGLRISGRVNSYCGSSC